VARSELDDVALDIVERFRNARLMVDAGDSFDLAHEALLRQWEPLAQLASAHESELRRRAELQSLAFTWERYGRKDGYLLFGEYLDEARDVLANERVPPLVSEFVEASLAADSFHRRRLADQLATHSLRVRDEDPQLALALAYTAVVECAGTPSAGHALRSALRHSLKLTLRGHQDWIRSLAWSPDGRLASACDDGTIRIWTMEDGGGSASAVLRGHQGWVRSVAWSPDGRLASGGDDGTVRLWTGDGIPITALPHHNGAVRSVAWSPDGRLAIGWDDGTVREWSSESESPRLVGRHDGSVRMVLWTADGRIASAGDDAVIRLWASAANHRCSAVTRARSAVSHGLHPACWPRAARTPPYGCGGRTGGRSGSSPTTATGCAPWRGPLGKISLPPAATARSGYGRRRPGAGRAHRAPGRDPCDRLVGGRDGRHRGR
jgi:hypothetical protein